MQTFSALVFVIFTCLALVKNAESAVRYTLPITDAHVHYLDFTQHSDGIKAFIDALNAAHVSDAIFTGMGLSKEWNDDEIEQPRYYLDSDTAKVNWDPRTDYLIANAYLRADKESQKRLHPFACGFNGNDQASLDYLKILLQSYPGVFQGIGEIFGHHDSLGSQIIGKAPNPASSGFKLLYSFAGKYHMPVLIHSNITTRTKTDKLLYLEQMENILQSYPETMFIWAHIGISRDIYVKNLSHVFESQLAKHSNLYVDISWFAWEGEINKDGKLDSTWKDMIIKYPTRFMIGTDSVAKFKDTEAYSKEIHKYDVLLHKLPPQIAQLVAHDNFLSLLPSPVILEPEDNQSM
jgi:hypothetical protein